MVQSKELCGMVFPGTPPQVSQKAQKALFHPLYEWKE